MNDIPDDESSDQLRKPFWHTRRMVRLSVIALVVVVIIAVGAPRPGGNREATFSKVGAGTGTGR